MDPGDEALLQYAESVLTARCMTELGFRFLPLSYEELQRAKAQSFANTQLTAFPYDANAEGLPYSPTVEALIEDPNQEHIRSLGEAEAVAYGDALQGFITDVESASVLGVTLGTPRAGCVSEARTELYGSIQAALGSLILAGNLQNISHQRARADPTVQAAIQDWLTCMTVVGYQFEDFSQARAAAAAAPTDAMVLATADGSCVSMSQLGSRYRSAFSDALQQLVEDDPAALTAVAETRTVALERARLFLESA